ncbi:MAG: glucose-6-phosphate dehydrogenase, partial [Patescibacteria group bacterium]
MSSNMVPTTLVIFGATGDLAEKKLIPALLDLFTKDLLSERFRILGISRRLKDSQDFRKFAREVIQKKKHSHSKSIIETFLGTLSYFPGELQDKETYKKISEELAVADKQLGQCSNKLFYLAVSPAFYDSIFQNLHDSGLSISCSGEAGWTRVLVEKPFGNDLETAKLLDRKLGLLFDEDQIFRIDHYLAKETLQNILAFRFSNSLFEPIWNRGFIKRIDIKLLEADGIGGRGAFYDGVGALRAVGQNHLLQMRAFVAMEDPKSLYAATVRITRARILEMLRPIDIGNMKRLVSRGQYKEYKAEENVNPNSQTETHFKIGVYIDNDRWQGVPFVLESGKKMKGNLTEISVYFKESEPFSNLPEDEKECQNVLKFHIQPKEGISVVFWAKKPGFKMELEPRELSFEYGKSKDDAALPDAYERILYDCINGDQTLFASTEEVEAAWR